MSNWSDVCDIMREIETVDVPVGTVRNIDTDHIERLLQYFTKDQTRSVCLAIIGLIK